MRVLKRNGNLEEVDINKIHKVLEHATAGKYNVSISQIELKAHIQLYDGISTSKINQLLINSAASLVTEETPEYDTVASKLLQFSLRKDVFNIDYPYDMPSLLQVYTRGYNDGLYDSRLNEKYSESDWEYFNTALNHMMDFKLSYPSILSWESRYLIRNRVTNRIYETPQYAYMLIAMTLFMNYPNRSRMKYVVNYYRALSNGIISVATPILSGARSSQYQYSSCTLIESDDSLDSINATASAVVKYASQKAGIGINIGKIRALKSKIRSGDAYHTGIIPFIKYFRSALKSCSQGGVRGSAGTAFFPIWHYEFPEMVVLKNNKGTEDNRVRDLDYGVQLSGLFYKRLLSGGNITLFSPSDVPGLYEAFFSNQEEFEKLYVKYESDESIRKRVYTALEIFEMLELERAETGRIYIHNVDHTNTHTPFDPEVSPIRQSNLCVEITLPTKPLRSFDDPEGEIALCILSAINWGKVTPHTIEEYCDLAVRALDALIDIQEYPVPAAKNSTMKYRNLGIGINNFAYSLAKIGAKYGDSKSLEYAYEMMEAQQYFCMKTSIQLAKEHGVPEGCKILKRSRGILPIDTQVPAVFEEAKKRGVELSPKQDWEELRSSLKEFGIRNATLTAIMPVESTSVIIGATNGVEPVRSLVTLKANKEMTVRQLVPGIKSLSKNYEILWDVKAEDYIVTMGVLQLFTDQAISSNTSYDPNKVGVLDSSGVSKIPLQLLLRDLILSYKMGLKTLYYHNTNDQDSESKEKPEEDNCVACKL